MEQKIIKNLLFDLGGVILDINYQRTEDAFIALGVTDFHEIYTQLRQSPLFDRLEVGDIEPTEFLQSLANHSKLKITTEQVRKAWNAMLIGLPAANLQLLRELKSHYRLFLFSNTNAIHYPAFNALIRQQQGIADFSGLFEQAYYSHFAKARKPDATAFNLVLQENGLKPQETLFIDDSPQHLEAASQMGFQTALKERNQPLRPLLKMHISWPEA